MGLLRSRKSAFRGFSMQKGTSHCVGKADCKLVAEEDFLGDEETATAVALRMIKVWPNIA